MSALGLVCGSARSESIVAIHGSGSHIQTADGRLYFEREGEGPPIILVAGGPGASHATFHPWFGRIADRRTVIYFDNLGRGRSDRLAAGKPYTIERDAEDIEALRRALGYERIVVLGHSYGGMPALAYALRHPERLAGLVLSDTVHSAAAFQENIDQTNHLVRSQFPEVWREVEAMRAAGLKSSDPRYAEVYSRGEGDLYWFEAAHAAKLFRSGQPADAFNRDVYHTMVGDDPDWVVGGTMRGWDARPGMRGIGVPVLICVGRFDRVATPKVALEMKDFLPEGVARLEVFERSGHRPWIEETERYFEVLGAFLSSLADG